MGSDSDLPILEPGMRILTTLGIPFTHHITSAHRTPALMTEFATTAVSKGYKIIIAAAGGAAHLAGMIAAMTPLPVIGVPVRASTLDGLDSLLSIVQMPRGVPVATVAINNSTNAALLAARILGCSDKGWREVVEKYGTGQQDEVLAKGERLGEIGWAKYLEEMKNSKGKA
jgi:phosphoribosylaminoimidazole carboxylase